MLRLNCIEYVSYIQINTAHEAVGEKTVLDHQRGHFMKNGRIKREGMTSEIIGEKKNVNI
jgi:hypothetical protein